MTLRDRYNSLPRAARWALWAVVLIVGYFLVVEPALDARNQLAASADTLAEQLRLERELTIKAGAAPATLGSPNLPKPAAAAKQEFYDRVNAILTDHGVSANRNERQVPLRQAEAAPIAPAGQRLERLILDLTFDATPSVVNDVIADLEASPEVTAIGRVNLRRLEGRNGSGGKIKAIISAEAWLLVENRT